MERKIVSGIILTLLLVSMLTLAFNIRRAKSSEPPPTEWTRTYGGGGTDIAYSVVQTGDGGYALAGYTTSFGAGSYDFYLVKTDSAGNMQWNQTYGGASGDYGRSVVQTPDGGYALAGYTGSPSWQDFYLVKTDSTGNTQWNKTYGGASDDEAYSVVQTGDGGYAIAGSGFANLVKTDANGNQQWNKTYGGRAYSLVNTVDDGYALVGDKGGDFWLVKTDSNGNMQWNQTYGGAGTDIAYSMVQTLDGGYAIAGETSSFGAGWVDFWLVKTDSAGNMVWNQTYGRTNAGQGGRSVVQTLDGGYALAGFINSSGDGDFWLVKTDSAGNMQWNQTYNRSLLDIGFSMVQTSDEGYAIAGQAWPFGPSGSRDFWLVKLGPAYTLTITATAGGTTSPSPGSYEYADGAVAVVSAIPDTGYIFDHWELDSFPVGSANPYNVTMNANHTLTAFFTEVPLVQYDLAISVVGSGTTDPAIGVHTYDNGTLVPVTAIPDAGWTFDHWELDSFPVGSANPYTVTMNANHSLTAFMHACMHSEWNQTYGGASHDQARSVVQTSDGGYAIAGYTRSFGAGGMDAWLVKTDSSGNHEWNKTYGGTNDDNAHSLVQTADGGYAMAGSTNSFGAGGFDFWLVKTDQSGNLQWSKAYGGPNDDEAHWGLVQTGDGGYLMAGNTRSYGKGGGDFWLVKTDSNGNMQWNQTYGGTSYDYAASVVQTSDGGYAIAGFTESFGAGTRDAWLVKTDSSGNHEWNKTYGETNWDEAFSVVETVDGGYAIAGHTRSFGASRWDWLLLRTDSSGNLLWSEIYGGAYDDYAHFIQQTGDGGYVIAGVTQVSSVGGSFDGWFVKTDSTGQMQWNQTFGEADERDDLGPVIETVDGGYALPGATGGPTTGGSGDFDFWLIKLACMHAIAVDLSVSSPDISFSDSNPSEGQTITISAKVHNLGERNLENITVWFFDGNASLGEQQISFISHHSQGIASIDWTANGEGFHLIKVVADPDDAIVEMDEENNEATRSVLVGEPWHYGGIIVSGNVNPGNASVGSKVTVYGNAIYNTTYGAGEPVAGADVTVTVLGQGQQWTTHTINDGTYTVDISAPYSPGNYTVVVTVTDFTFWESLPLGLTVFHEDGVDLTLSYHDISFSPSDPVENDSVSITASIHNVGTQNATDVLVAFYADGESIGNTTFALIVGGGSENASASWNATPWGWHMIRVVIDPDNAMAELNENNNEAYKNIYVYPAFPDLTPTNVYFSDRTPVVNQPIIIYADVRNIGGVGASNVSVSFYDGNQSIGNVTIPVIPGKGQSRTASITHSFTADGCHLINATVDIHDSIHEADEVNNWYSMTVCVHLPLPDLTLSGGDITFSKSTPTIGDIITIYAAIHNIGETDAYNIAVEFFDNHNSIAPPLTISSINASEQETVNVSWNATPSGWHRIKVVIDGNNTITESNEENNYATRYIYVSPLVAADLCIYSEDIVFSNTNPGPGDNVTIYATVHNIGEAEAHNVTVTFYVDDFQLGLPVGLPSISVDGEETVSTSWFASQIGSHVVKVVVDTLVELNKYNNNATRAIIVGNRDVAVTDVVPSESEVYAGAVIDIDVTIRNEGQISETFNVTAFYGSNVIQTQVNVSLNPGMQSILPFSWNTTDAPGNHIISAVASVVAGEIDTSDNIFVNGFVEVVTKVDIPIKGGENATIEGNVTITNALVTKNSLHFDASGPSGSTGWINVTFPMVNTTQIKVFINHQKLTPPPFPVINTNGTHYFIYFEFTLSTHNITIQFGPELPYDVTIDAYCHTEDAYVSVSITMDGNPTGYNTPHTFTGLTNTHTFTVPNTDANGHPFQHWSTGPTSTTITVSLGGTYTAYYQAYTLTITTTTGGTTNPTPGSYEYAAGAVAVVSAIPDINYWFDHWELDGNYFGSTNPRSVTMNTNHTLHAVFVDTLPPSVPEYPAADISIVAATFGFLAALYFTLKRKKQNHTTTGVTSPPRT